MENAHFEAAILNRNVSDVSVAVVERDSSIASYGSNHFYNLEGEVNGKMSRLEEIRNSTLGDANASYIFQYNMSGNSSSSTEEPQPLESPTAFIEVQIAVIALYTVICLIAVLGNSCVVYVVLSRRRMRNVTNYFIASLAVSDILMAVVCIPFTFVANVLLNYWPFGATLCPIVPYLQTAIVFQNAYTMLAMSLERYIAIMHPFLRRLGKRRCLQIVALCWVLAFLTPIPTAVTSQLNEFKENNETYHLCFEDWGSEHQRFSYSVTIMVLQYFVPLAVLVFTYSKIVHVIWLKDMPAPAELLNHGEREEKPKEKEPDPRKKVIKMMISVVGIYGICWLPLHVITIVADVDNTIFDAPSFPVLWVASHWLAMSSCAYNPFIYWWMNPKFQEGYISMFRGIRNRLCCLCYERKTRKESTTSVGSRRFFSKFGNGSGNTSSNSRRQSNTQMVEFTGLFCDGTHNSDSSSLSEHGKVFAKEAEFIPELSKISECTENGTSFYGGGRSICLSPEEPSEIGTTTYAHKSNSRE